jgi:tRNA (guanine-N(7)-)-methyltransferase subunit TRM82
MLFIISDQYLVLSVDNESYRLSQLTFYDLKYQNKSPIIIDLSQIVIDKNINDFNTREDDKKQVEKVDETNYEIICGAFSLSGKYLAICDNKKQLIILSNVENNWIVINRHKVVRNCIKLLFSMNEELVICGDKSGDCYSYSVSNDGRNDGRISGQLLLGHCSMLLDMSLTNDSKYLITCDRDEKIRVSHYPNTYNIESFCLGHKEFVSSIALINNQTLVSGSGDGSVRLWNLINGKEIYALMCDKSESLSNNNRIESKYAVKRLVTNRIIDPKYISVSFYKQSIVNIYAIESNSLRAIHSLELDEEPIDIKFDVSNCHLLWVLLPISDNPLNVYEITDESVKKSNFYSNIIKELNSNQMFKNNCLKSKNSNALESLYKHWFNNVETYFQKKHERQESIKKKKNF